MAPLLAAEQWGVPPWVIEEEAPALWMARWTELHNARAEQVKRREKERGRQHTGMMRRRLV